MRAALCLLFGASAFAQLNIEVTPTTGRAPERLKEAQRRLNLAGRTALTAPAGEDESAALDTALRTLKTNFLPALNSESRIATIVKESGDILTARASVADPDGAIPVTIWDTPQDTAFIFTLPRHCWSSGDSLKATLNRLFRPSTDAPIFVLTKVMVSTATDPLTHQQIGTGGLLYAGAPRQFDPGPLNWLDFWETASASYLSATFVKFSLSIKHVPERFPSLAARAATWTKEHILEVLNSGTIPARDGILTRELLKRDVTDDEMLALFRRPRPADNLRVMDAVIDMRQTKRFENAIRRYLSGLQRDYGLSKRMGLDAQVFALLRPVPDVDFTQEALSLALRDSGAGYAFGYAAARARSADAYRQLKSIAPFREFELKSMRTRLGLDEDGNPIPH
jgi:hypothetical protein